MSLTERDKKIVLLLIPLVLAAAYWFLLLAPKRDEASQVKEQLAQEETKRDEAVSKAAQLEGAKRGFSDDYATVIHLGKALPTSVDMPSLLVQLDRAARGTGIEFDKIATGDRETAPAGNAGSGSSGSSGNSAAGGEPAQTGGGQATEAANNAAETSNARNGQAGGGASGGATGGGGTSSVAGLDTVPLDFEFTGSFFDLADFFHRMKRFVRVTNERIIVRGRLLTVDSFKFTAGEDFPQLKAEIKATVYLAPRAQGTAAGATPAGPPSSGGGNETASNPTTPTATATP